VAIKVLPRELASKPGYEQRFRREASIAARLTEPQIIPIFEPGEIDGQLYLVMPVISGIDVQTVFVACSDNIAGPSGQHCRPDRRQSPHHIVTFGQQPLAAATAAVAVAQLGMKPTLGSPED
jgi:serine/threonine protein kinase